MESELKGSILALFLYDVCEEIRLEELQQVVAVRPVDRSFKHLIPEYVHFQHAPVLEPLSSALTGKPECCCSGQIKYYDYGVVSIIFEFPFQGDWTALVENGARWMSSSELDQRALDLAREKVQGAAAALSKPYPEWLKEDFLIIHVREISGSPSALSVLSSNRGKIAQLVRGETVNLSDDEIGEIVQSSISYYPSDLAVIGWNAAFLYDTASGAGATIQILEYANSQLLEFRHYDEFLTQELSRVYRSLDRGTGIIQRWSLARSASRLQAVALEVTELVERVDNSIKFLSDMFSARLYRVAAKKVGVYDYKNLVNQKLQTANELYHFMIEQFNQGRAFVLELLVVIILVIELFYFFRGEMH